MGLPCGENFVILSSTVFVWSTHVTDGRTDWRAIASITSLVTAAVSDDRRRSAYLSSSKFQHITPLLRQLHWLKAPEQIAFKQTVLVYKCLHGFAPPYLTSELCQVLDVEARQRLRSSSSSSLMPHTTPYWRWPSFPGGRCACLEQSARSCHFRTFRSSLPVLT